MWITSSKHGDPFCRVHHELKPNQLMPSIEQGSADTAYSDSRVFELTCIINDPEGGPRHDPHAAVGRVQVKTKMPRILARVNRVDHPLHLHELRIESSGKRLPGCNRYWGRQSCYAVDSKSRSHDNRRKPSSVGEARNGDFLSGS